MRFVRLWLKKLKAYQMMKRIKYYKNKQNYFLKKMEKEIKFTMNNISELSLD